MDLNLKLNRILFSMLLLTLGYSQKVIAVADITSEGLSKIQRKQIFNTLESALVNLGAYEVTSRSEVDKILAEQKFQSMGCTDQQCAAEIGRLLNADFMLLSDILYEGGEISITIKLVDVETAKIVTAISKYESINKIGDIFDKIPNYLLELYRNQNKDRRTPTSTTQQTEKAGIGKLIVRSDPIGAKVILDNQDLGLTPIEKDLEAGKHRLILTYEGYERFAKSVTVVADTTETVEAELVPLTGDLSIITTPGNSDVFINDEYKGKSPLTLQYLEVGEYFIKITQTGYQDELTKVSVEWNLLNTIEKKLIPLPGSVAFYSVPDGAEVLIDNRSRGVTKSTGLVLDIPAGSHKISIKKKGYITETTEIDVKAGETTDLELSLSKLPEGVSEDPNMGWISLMGSPKKSQIVLKGKNYTSPLKYHELKKGTYRFKVSHNGYKSKNISFDIHAQKHAEYKFNLNPIDRKRAKKLALMFPGRGHFYAEKQTRGMVFMALGTASIYGTYTSLTDYQTNSDAYDIAKADYLTATDPAEIARKFSIYENLGKDKTASLIGTVGFGSATIIVWVWNIYDLNKSLPSVFDIGMNTNGQLEASFAF